MNNIGEEQERGNIKNRPVSGFAHYLYVTVIIQKKTTAEALSKLTGASSSAIYKWMEGENPIPLWFFEAYIKTTHDFGYLDFMESEVGRSTVPLITNKNHAAAMIKIAEVLNCSANGGEKK